MSLYKRPWWLIVNKSDVLTTTIQEEAHPGERIFVIRGEPMVQGLAWLVWGPVAALLVVAGLIWLAVYLDIRAQTGAMRALLILALLILPALVWGIVALVLQLLSRKYLLVERQAELQECFIRLNQKQATLFYQTTAHPTEEKIPYAQIQQVRVTPAIGSQDIKQMRLVLETDNGPIILLNEKLGTFSQKNDLAQEIGQAAGHPAEK
jgi:hypothetical protein